MAQEDVANETLAQRLGRVLETVTRQSGRLQETPAYGSWLLGRVSESQERRRVRIQVILTVLVLAANLIGIAVALLLVTVAIPEPSVFDRRAVVDHLRRRTRLRRCRAWLVGTYWITRRTVLALRWAIEERKPTRADERNTFLAPWRVAIVDLILWGIGTAAVDDPLRPGQHACSSRRFLFGWAFAAFWSPPPAICSPSSRCARWPHRRSRRDDRRDG